MCCVNPSRICGGVTFAVVAVALAAITAIALAIIFAPPFLAAYAAVALYVSVGCGIGAAVATLAAIILLRNKSTHSPSNLHDTIKLNPNTETESERKNRIECYLVKADEKYNLDDKGRSYSECVKIVTKEIEDHSKFEQFKKQYNHALADFDLAKDPNLDSAILFAENLEKILNEMNQQSTE